jgi:hypothetical protein
LDLPKRSPQTRETGQRTSGKPYGRKIDRESNTAVELRERLFDGEVNLSMGSLFVSEPKAGDSPLKSAQTNARLSIFAQDFFDEPH